MDNIVNKLYSDAHKRKRKNESTEKKKEASNLVTNESKQVILEKLVKEYELNIINLLNKKLGDELTYDEFCIFSILIRLRFTSKWNWIYKFLLLRRK